MRPLVARATVTLFACLCFAHSALASDHGVTLIPQAGINVILLNQDPKFTKDSEGVGFQFGISVRRGDRFYIQPGLFYQHTRVSQALLDPQQQLSVKFESWNVTNDIYLPLLFGAKFFEGHKRSVRASLGPAATFLLSVPENLFSTSAPGEAMDRSSRTAIRGAFVVGVGVDLNKLTFDASYDLGFTRVYKVGAGGSEIPFEPETTEDVFRFSIGALFR